MKWALTMLAVASLCGGCVTRHSPVVTPVLSSRFIVINGGTNTVWFNVEGGAVLSSNTTKLVVTPYGG